jgi:hypothetical protein
MVLVCQKQKKYKNIYHFNIFSIKNHISQCFLSLFSLQSQLLIDSLNK